jgi:diguanylate cyclase (GGDEF)-like protein
MEATSDTVRDTEHQIEAELHQWSQRAATYFRQKATELKEILIIMARAAETAGERDHRYSTQFQELTGRFESIADLNDLTEIRNCLAKSASELRACVNNMAKDGQQSVAQLRQEVERYQARLDEAERLASLDVVTGLSNRSKVESSIEIRLAQPRTFSVMMFDLNEFKQINDTYGHLAGDEVLKQFAGELQAAFGPLDVVGRWGGDEFVVVLDGGHQVAASRLEHVRKWVFGSYTIQMKGVPVKVSVSAAAGVAERKAGDKVADLVARADATMYRDKSDSRNSPMPIRSDPSVSHVLGAWPKV